MGMSKVGDLTQQDTVALLAPALYQLQVKYTEAERPPVVPERHLSRGLSVLAWRGRGTSLNLHIVESLPSPALG